MRGSWEPAALIHHFGPGQLWPVWSIQTPCGPGDMQHIAAQNVTLDSDDLTSFRSRLFQLLELCTQYYAYLENRNNCNTVISMAQYTRISYLLGKTLQLPWPTNYATINHASHHVPPPVGDNHSPRPHHHSESSLTRYLVSQVNQFRPSHNLIHSRMKLLINRAFPWPTIASTT